VRSTRPRTLALRSFQSRILAFFLSLFAAVLVAVLIAVTVVSTRSARDRAEQELLVAARVFDRIMQDRLDDLTLGARLLSGDFAFKQAYATGDRQTLRSALINLQRYRLGADVMMLVDTDGETLLVDTSRPGIEGVRFAFPELIARAEASAEPQFALGVLEGTPHQLIVVPLLAPVPVAWFVVGYQVNDALAQAIEELTLTDIAFFTHGGEDAPALVASSLAPRDRSALAAHPPRLTGQGLTGEGERRLELDLAERRYLAVSRPLAEHLTAVLARSLDDALAPFAWLHRMLLLLTALGLAVSVVGAVLIARSVTRPVRELAEAAHRVGRGDLMHRVRVERSDELGELATAFNHMTQALTAFQRYVPTDLVRTLIAKGIESRPERRTATMLYTDIEGFTALAEHRSPEAVVALLNDYFAAVSPPVEREQGIITQYQGDAFLATFNVPADNPDHATSAVRAATAIKAIVEQRVFTGGVRLRVRMGIATGVVVAGSVGSAQRLNYTVHGDAVNLAARLEALNKTYGTTILAAQETSDSLTERFHLRRLEPVDIRGRDAPLTVYEVIGTGVHANPMTRLREGA